MKDRVKSNPPMYRIVYADDSRSHANTWRGTLSVLRTIREWNACKYYPPVKVELVED